MDKHFSAYLDTVRVLAAVLVVLDHLASHGLLPPAILPWVPELGRESVIIFFVLSGLVIAYITERREHGLRRFLAARAGRIWSVALPMLLLSFGAAYAMRHGAARSFEGDYQLAHPWLYLILHGLFLGQSWTLSETPPWLESYWSLDYEVWYYILFAAVFFLRARWRLLAVVAVLAVMGYKLWLLLPLWASGVWFWRMRARWVPGRVTARLGWGLSLVLLGLYAGCVSNAQVVQLGEALWPTARWPLGSASRFVGDYMVTILVLFNFHCALHARLAMPERLAKLARASATLTFPLYMVHGLVISLYLQSTGVRTADAWPWLLAAIILASWLLWLLSEMLRRWLVGTLGGGTGPVWYRPFLRDKGRQ